MLPAFLWLCGGKTQALIQLSIKRVFFKNEEKEAILTPLPL